MATFSDLSTIASNGNFQARVQYALAVAAVNVYAEDPTTSGHGVRKAFALRCFAGDYNIVTLGLMVLTNATIAAEANISTTPGYAIPDSDIQFAVNSLWNDMAGL